MLVLKIAAGIILAVVVLIFGFGALSTTSNNIDIPADGLVSDALDTDTTGDGTYLVGSDVFPGTYRLPAAPGGRSCYWARLRNLDGGVNSIITNNITDGPSVIHIAASDYAVEFSGCDTSNVLG